MSDRDEETSQTTDGSFTKEKKSRLKREVKTANVQLKAANVQLKTANDELAKWENHPKDCEKQIKKLNAEAARDGAVITALTSSMTDKDKEIARLQTNLKAAKTDVDATQAFKEHEENKRLKFKIIAVENELAKWGRRKRVNKPGVPVHIGKCRPLQSANQQREILKELSDAGEYIRIRRSPVQAFIDH